MRNYPRRGMQPHRYSEPADARDLDQSDPRGRCDAISTFLLPPLASSASNRSGPSTAYYDLSQLYRTKSFTTTSNPGNQSPLRYTLKTKQFPPEL